MPLLEKVQEHLINIDAHLSNMEHRGFKENTDVSAVAKAKLKCEAAAKELEVETKCAMEKAGRAFLKEKRQGSTLLGILRSWNK
jgi:hypothetical protein